MTIHWHYGKSPQEQEVLHLFGKNFTALCGYVIESYEISGCNRETQQERENARNTCKLCRGKRDLLIIAE
jgi:hypothetical protein